MPQFRAAGLFLLFERILVAALYVIETGDLVTKTIRGLYGWRQPTDGREQFAFPGKRNPVANWEPIIFAVHGTNALSRFGTNRYTRASTGRQIPAEWSAYYSWLMQICQLNIKLLVARRFCLIWASSKASDCSANPLLQWKS